MSISVSGYELNPFMSLYCYYRKNSPFPSLDERGYRSKYEQMKYTGSIVMHVLAHLKARGVIYHT